MLVKIVCISQQIPYMYLNPYEYVKILSREVVLT